MRSPMTACCVVIAAATALSGCLGRSPDVRLYTITAQDGPVVTTASPDLAVMVGPARLPQYLDRPEIARRGEGGRIEFDSLHRWAGGLESNLLRALGSAVAQRLASDRVAVYPGEPPFRVAFRVSIDFSDLVADEASGELRVDARWTILDEKAPPLETPTVGTSRITQSIGRGSVDAIVKAHDEAVGALADAISRRLASVSLEMAEEEAP